MRRYVLIFLILISNSFLTQGQWSKNIDYYLNIGKGDVLPVNDFVKGKNIDGKKIKTMKSFNLSFSKTLDYSKPWQKQYSDLRYGAGLNYGVFNYSKNLGNPISIYGFMGFTPVKKQNFRLNNQIGIGLSFLWEKYDKENNPYNIAVSKDVEVYINWQLTGLWRINDNWYLGMGVDVTHFSNGATVKPNKGLNIISPTINLNYRPKPLQYNITPDSAYNTDNINHYISFYRAIHADFVKDSIQNSSKVYGLQYRALRELTYKYNFGLGADITYSDAIYKNMVDYYNNPKKIHKRFKDHITISCFLSFEYDIHRLSVVLEPGVYLYKSSYAYFPKYYQRIGAKFDISDKIFAQVNLRAYKLHIADYIEYSLGYKITQH